MDDFERRNETMIREMGADREMSQQTSQWFQQASKWEYSYHFKWLGLPIIQFPQDLVAIQEIVWQVKPDLIIEIIEQVHKARQVLVVLSTQRKRLFGPPAELA